MLIVDAPPAEPGDGRPVFLGALGVITPKLTIFATQSIQSMAIAYHGSAALFSRFDPVHLLEGDGKFKFGVGAYLTSRYTTAAHYSGASGNPEHYVYTVDIPELTDVNHLTSLKPVHPEIVAKAEQLLGEPIPQEARQSGKFFRKYIGNTLIGAGKTLKQRIGSASLEAEKAVSAFLPRIGVVLLVWPTAQTKPEAGNNYALLDYDAFHILQVDKVELDAKDQLIEGSQQLIAKY